MKLNGDIKHEEDIATAPPSPVPSNPEKSCDSHVIKENREAQKKGPIKDEKEETNPVAEKSSNNGVLTSNCEEVDVPFIWPKDRVLYQRLELVCYCIGRPHNRVLLRTGTIASEIVVSKVCRYVCLQRQVSGLVQPYQENSC